MWASVFGFGWNGFWLKGDGTNGIEDIKVDVIGGTGIFEDCGRTNYYTISGHVYTSDTTTGMSGVIISGGQAGSVTTNANGYYCVSVIEGWSGTVVPSKAGYRFSPANSSYTNVQANQSQSFTGEVTTHYISGHVYKNCTKTGLSGVTVTYSNAGCDTIDSVITDTSGYFIHTVQYGWSGTIAPSLVGYVFFPSNISFYNVQSFSWGWVINGFSTSYYNISLRLDSISGSGGVLSDTVRINYSFTDSSGSLGRVENFYYSIGDTLSWTLVGQSALVDNTYRREGSYSFGWDSREQFPDSSAMDVYIKFNLEHDQIIDTWSTSVGSLSDARERLACGVVNGKIYAIGGYSVRGAVLWVDVYKNRAEEYNPATNTWTTKAPMSMNRCFLAACGLNGKVYALGGGNSTTASNFTATNLVEEYDPSTDTWTIKTPMPTARYGLVVAAVNGKIYAIGGDSAGGGLNTVEEYDPKTDTWAAKAPMPTKRYHMAAGVIDNKIYVAGGLNTTWISTLEVYDPATDTWESKASMPINNYGLGGEVVNGRLYVIGGSNSSDEITNVYEYDPVANNWTAKTFMPWPRYYFGTGVVADGIYVVGGSHIVPLYTVLRYNATRFPSNYVVSPLLTIKNEPQTGFMPFPAIYCDQTTVLQVENPAKVIAIGITVPKNERVKLEIADINGNTVATLADDMLLAGKHKFNLNEPVNTGIYFIKLMTKEYTETRRVLILQ
jgi:N-acetylneuraminic acid mutarotase